MFASRVFRPAASHLSALRRYASTESGGTSATSYALPAAAGLGLCGGGYWYLNSGKKPESVAPASKEEEKTIPATSSRPVKVFTGGDQGFISLTLDKVEDINHNTKKFRFKLPQSDGVSGLNVASALVTKFKPADKEKPVIRPYTPTSDEDTQGFMDLIVKRYPNGPMSEHLHAMKPGEDLEMKGPIPKYPYAENKHSHIALIAGGTGITPMYQLCRAIFKNPQDKTKVTLVFGNVTKEDILLKKEFDELEAQFPDRFRAFHVLGDAPPDWKQGKGFITKDLLKTVIPGPKDDNVKVFVCGPPGLYKAISGTKKSPAEQGELTGYLKELGYSQEQVYKF